jgi:hypothetical protein
MKNFFLYLVLCLSSIFYAQNEKSVYIYNDSILSIENLPVSNGLFHYNSFNIANNLNIYYKNEKYISGDIEYQNQKYFDFDIKYDVYNDDLIFRPSGDSEKNGIILVKNNIVSFEIYDTKFINIEKIDIEDLQEKGYFEESYSTDDFKVLIKHFKTKKDVLSKSVLQNVFYDSSKIFILKNRKLKKINSKNNIIKLFPEKKELINNYFKDYSLLKKTNKQLFYKNLFKKMYPN